MKFGDPKGYTRAIIHTSGERSMVYKPGFFMQVGKHLRIKYFQPFHLTNRKTGEKVVHRGEKTDVVAVKDITKCTILHR